MKSKILEEISQEMSLSVDTLIEKGVEIFLRERRKRLKLDILSILGRYDVSSSGELEGKIRAGEIKEHPAWEDLVVVENLEAALRKIDGYLEALSRASSSSDREV